MNFKVTHNGKRWSNAEQDYIELVEYNPEWPAKFHSERELLISVLPSHINFTIEHFGSTAIPGMTSKPIIDIFLICDYVEKWKHLIKPLQSIDYIYWKDNPRTGRMLFVKGMPPYGDGRTHHVHVRKSVGTKDEILFREYMIHHPKEAIQYTKLKRKLMSRFETDRDAYSKGKNEYLKNIIKKAKKWDHDNQ